MKFEIIDAQKNKEKESIVQIWLEENPHGDGVILKAKLPNWKTRDSNFLLQITEKDIFLFGGIEEELGFKLDENGYLKIAKEK